MFSFDYGMDSLAIRMLLALLLIGCLSTSATAQYKSENLFYYVDNEQAYSSFKNHIDQISIVAPQSFSVSKDGVVWGEVDPRVLSLAKKRDVQVIPLIVNPGFNQELFHTFLQDSAARQRTINMMVKLAKKYGFAGWQFDFENISLNDREAYTDFYRQTAEAFDDEGLSLSAAVVPTNTNFDLKSAYHRFLYESWRGGYNMKALAKIGDFLSLMTYSQHTSLTPPGPVAGLPWMKEMVEYLLDAGVNPQKISLGIPFYSNYWYADYSEKKGGFVNGSGASYDKVRGMIEKYDAEVVWMEKQKTHYALWSHDGVFEYAFLEDARSIKSKLQLLKQYNLRGFSVWRLGQEDPDVWSVIQAQTNPVVR